jgi:nitroimidazol reductase NimA-like FMN-containing flavoprotein (pyridoxamine 5'-phosphate oxidase superfamily)
MAAEPARESFQVPAAYGKTERLLEWEPVRARLEAAKQYWFATVRPDGRPHVVPLDGSWLDDRWYFGGSPETVKHRNLLENPRAALHLEDAMQAVIVEGTCEVIEADEDLAQRLSDLSRAKYGYGPEPAVYRNGVWCLQPVRVLAWEQFPADATRFVFG